MSNIVAICNQKGGTGKTTTAVNLSTSLALIGKKILLIDIDPQGNATSGVGIDKNSVENSVYQLLLSRGGPQEAIIPTQIENLSIIPSNVDLTGAEVELVGAIGREYRLKKALQDIKDQYDCIFIDCPPSLGLLTINALSAADCVLIPVQCEYYALEGLSLLLNTVNLVIENLNSSLYIKGVVLTMADFRTNLTREVINEAKEHFQNQIYETIIPRNIKLTEAPSYGKPISLYDRHSLGAKAYQDLALEFIGMSKQESAFTENNIIVQSESNDDNSEEDRVADSSVSNHPVQELDQEANKIIE